jgi:hypothetical protein
MKYLAAIIGIACVTAAFWFALPYILFFFWGLAGFPVAIVAVAMILGLALTAATFVWRWARNSN